MEELINSWAGILDVSWIPVLNKTINLGSQYKIVPTEGYIAWEYNPLRNYRLNEYMYEKDGKYYTTQELKNILTSIGGNEFSFYDEFGKILKDDELKDKYGEEVYKEYLLYTLKEPGELVDFITNELSFNLQHPVEILPQYSYDGSVNLILNDGLNIPRLINSRFTVTGKNTYKIIDRKGDNDTNIYDLGEQFDVDTSLFKNVNKIPKLEYLGTASGNMKIGNYHFYFKYSDSDGNESDWVAESGLVSVFIGGSPNSINTGIRDENSIKSVKFKLSNIDIGYSYVKVYYTRYSADVNSNFIISAKRIDKNFIINNSGTCLILITGDENETDVTLEEINSSFDVIQNAQTLCSSANRLFMANIHKSRIEYDMLSKLSLCFCPYKHTEEYPLSDGGINENYEISASSYGYYDSEYIYNKTSYWPGELYRLGVVYILKDGSLSPVFNIRGATNIPIYNNENIYKIEDDFSLIDNETGEKKSLELILSEIDYSEEDYMIIGGKAENENAKGVIQLKDEKHNSSFPILGVNIKANYQVIKELKKYCKGFFFVRQKRMPLTLCQGLVIGLDKESRTPTLPLIGGIINNILERDSTALENSATESNDINDINYISEGFLTRYHYKFDKKPTDSGKVFLKVLAATAIVVAAAAIVIFTCGAGAAVIGAGLAITAAAAAGAGAIAVGAAATALAITVGVGVAVGAISAGIHWLVLRPKRESWKEAKPLYGRNVEVPKGCERKELDDSRILTNDIYNRIIITNPEQNVDEAIIVPDYQINQPYYNQFLTGDDFIIKLNYEQPSTSYATDGYFDNKDRHFYVSNYQLQDENTLSKVKLVGVPDSCPVKMIGDSKYRARAGYAEEAYKYECLRKTYEDELDIKENAEIIRGNFGSYVGISNYLGHALDQINIMIPGYQDNKLFEYILLRALDTSSFYAISDRIDINLLNQKTSILDESEENTNDFSEVFYRGDSYICQYSHRIIRNFNDPSAPYNDKIVDKNCWKENYDPNVPEDYEKINLGDVNAVLLGLWVTFLLRSSYNLNIRTVDKSNIDEYLMCGNYRSFYPNYGQTGDGALKIPDSDQYNKGFSKSVSEKYYFEVPNVPYIKQEFLNRIVFSDIHINDAYKNGFRVLRTMNHKDYPMTYGSITKLIELQNSLLVIFEHGIGLITINNSSEHPSQILSDLSIISDTYGSLWKDSILKTPSGIYGVDTVAKKIWRVRNASVELISDMKVQEFLNQNISLSERELTPILGIRNVKTVYNAFKHDIMFTFYDNLYGIHEKSWNLCYNEMLGIFTTFYSWIPSDMQNIDNIPFSFNRDTVKAITKLGISDHGNDFSEGITLSNNILNYNKFGFTVKDHSLDLNYINKQGKKENFKFVDLKDYHLSYNDLNLDDPIVTKQSITELSNFIGFLYVDNRILFDEKTKILIKYELLRDRLGNHKLFEIKSAKLAVEQTNELLKNDNTIYKNVQYLILKPEININELLSELYYRNNMGNSYSDIDLNKISPTYINGEYIIHTDKPIFKNKSGKRLMLPKNLQINPDKIVRYLNIKANIYINSENESSADAYYNQFVDEETSMIDAGYFESNVAITTDFNLQLLSTDFWKHGQSGIIDITDKIYPTYWYGQQHPFEFECVVVENPSVHKIFTNLELIANKVKPESFHYEVIGDVYDFTDDKPTMYFRQEALKALYQYNGYDIEYNPNFLEIEPKLHNRSADLPKYYSRWNSINEIYDSYKRFSAPSNFNYDHLAGAEIVYYPTRNEFRVWNHAEAIDVDSLSLDLATSVIKANCRYLEDKWLVSINPIIVTYKNEIDKSKVEPGQSMFSKDAYGIYKYSSWVDNAEHSAKLPPINIHGTKLQEKFDNAIKFPGDDEEHPNDGKDNALYGLYDLKPWIDGGWKPIDPVKNKDRKETDVRGKFMKVRIRYSGEELAIIDFLNTIYQISFA